MPPWRNEAISGVASQIAARLPGYCWAISYDQVNGLAISDGDFCCHSHRSAEALADIWAPPQALNLEAEAIWDIFNSNLIFRRRDSRSRGVSNFLLAVLVFLPRNVFTLSTSSISHVCVYPPAAQQHILQLSGHQLGVVQFIQFQH